MSGKRKPLILDLHIPYCIHPMKYLNYFYEMGTNEQKNEYIAAMKKEVLSYKGELDDYEVQAIRLGGGSATVMKPDLLGELLTLVRRIFPVMPRAEVSFDALPNTIGTPSLTGIASGHPTRAELMMRSENDEELRTLNCPFTMQHVRNAMLFFHKFRLNNIGLTVNYGIPGQTLHSWQNTLYSCTIMHPGHITVSPLDVTDAEGMPDEETRFALYNHACDFLQEQGYCQYSAEGFSLPHYEYRYEVLRMDGTERIGLGVNGISLLEGYLTRNTNNCRLYVKNAGDFEKLTAQAVEADRTFYMREYVLGRLGLTKGISEQSFEERFGADMPEKLRLFLKRLEEKGWAEEQENTYTLTRKGMFHYRDILALPVK